MPIRRPLRALVAAALSLAACSIAMAAPQENVEPGFKSLFNGHDLTGWDGNPKFWSVRDGAITGQTTAENPTPGNTFLIWRDGALDDFELRLSFRIVGGNSGIQYRSQEASKWVVGGYQADFEAGTRYSGILYEERGRGVLADRGKKVVIDAAGKKNDIDSVGDSAAIQAAIKSEDWNDYVIIAQDNHLVHKINGHVTVDVTDDQATHRSMSGILALQVHAGPPMRVQFKNIRAKRLPLIAAKKIVLVAGRPSHGPKQHEFNAGVHLLKKCLDGVPGVRAAMYLNGWPRDASAFDNADSILFYMDGGGGHPMIQESRLQELGALMKRGVGLACAHYAVEVPKERGGTELLAWIGGYYERPFSINPHWTADFKRFPKHPVTRGVQPFAINDEWYFNMRFPTDAKNVQPILVATPPDDTRRSPASAEFPGRPEVVAWVIEREDGGRGFGFTGGHNHVNWGNEQFRRLFLNALLWSAKAEVPAGGVQSTVTAEDLERNLDPK